MADKIIFEVVATAKGVKVVQQQTDKLAKSSDKATKSTKNLDKSRDAYNRREKGAANISSNATKNFSKMQQGIDGGGGSGGLVRAYALLAANVFALTAAFGVLSRSAQIDTLTQSMEVLSTTGGTYIKTLAMDLRDASGGAIDLAQSFRQVSLATSAGLNVKEIEGLTQVAKGAALSLGRDLPDAMDRIFRGAIKLEPEILDEIGLFVRVDEAAEKYARSIGKSASSLTQAEKRQGFLNEILDQGSRKFQQYADTIKPDPYVKIAAALSDVAQSALSLVNDAFGPLIGFLAESKGLLTLVFGAVVFSLLRLAVPAIGQFNQGLAESAQKAADNARDYSKGISETTKLQIKEDNKKVKSALEAQQKINRARKPLALKVGGKDVSSKLELDLQNKEIKGAERLEKVKERIAALETKQGLARRQAIAGYDEELSALREELSLEQQITDLRTREGRAKTVSDPGTNAAKKQAALDQRAMTAGALSTITGTAETKGLGAAFDELKGKLKETQTVGGKTVKTFTGMNRGLFALRGGFGIAAVGAQGLMMSLGPIMMIVGLALPLLIGMAKAMGFMSEESKALTEDVNKLNDVIEDVGKRFKTQTDQIKSGTLSYFEGAKAANAFAKGQVDVVSRMKEVGKSLKDFDKESGAMASGWDGFVSTISFGNWGQKAAANTSLVTAAAEQLGGAVRAGDTDLINIFAGALDGSEEYTSALQNQIKAEEDNAVSAKALKEANLDSRKNLKKLTELSKMAYMEESRSAPLRKKFADATKDLSDEELNYVRTLGTLDKAQGKTAMTMRKLSGETDTLLDKADEATVALGKDGIGGALTKVEVAAANLESALTEAGEAAGKFSAAFNVKTAIDDFANSLGVVKRAAEKAEGGLNKFLTDVADSEQANEFTRFFTEAELAIFALAETSEEAGKTAQGIFDKTVQDVKLYQRSLIMTKVDAKRLTDEIKRFGEVSSAGNGLANAQAKKETDLAKVKANGAKLQFEMRLKDAGMDREAFAAAEALVALKDTELEKAEALSGSGMTLSELYGAQADKNADIAASQALQVASLSESQRANIDITKQKLAQVTAQKQLNTATQNQAKLTAENLALETRGTSKLSKQEQAQLSMQTALDTFEITKQEVALKMTMLDFEMQIQKIKLQVLKESLPEGSDLRKQIGNMGDLKTGEGATDMFATINSAKQTTEEALGVQLSNADLAISNTLKKSVETAFTGGLADGLLMVPQALAKFKERAEVEGQSPEDREKEDTKFASELQGQAFRASMDSQAEALKKLGPEGELVASVVQGAFAISDAYSAMGTAVENGADKTAAGLQFAASAIGQIGQMMAANSKAQIAEVDAQIDAEKKRDGKSAESIAKIKAMEAKKEAMKKKAFEQDKKVKMAQTVASTAAAIMQTLATGGAYSLPMAIMIGAMGAAQLAIIQKTKYSGGSSEVQKPAMGALSIGKRDNKVDVSRGASGGELAYMRGARGVGSNANNFTPTGGAYGMKSYAAGGEGILVGEQGPEIVTPTQPVDVMPTNMGGAQNVNFTINAVDAEGIESVLENQRGNIIGMIRSAANGYGTGFLEEVDTDVVSSGGYQKA